MIEIVRSYDMSHDLDKRGIGLNVASALSEQASSFLPVPARQTGIAR